MLRHTPQITNHSPRGREIEKSHIRDLINSEDPFPVDFDEAWQWCGYNKKSDGKNKLLRNFTKGSDYQFLRDMPQKSKGRPLEKIKLSVDAFKAFAMMAGTDKGKEVRKYFIDCEKELHQLKMMLLEEKDQQIKQIEASTKDIKLKFRLQDADFFTIGQYCKVNGLAVSESLLKEYSARCIDLSKKIGKKIYSVSHPVYKRVMVYHLDVLRLTIK